MSSDERSDFSRRLAAAMRAAGYEPRPSVLHTQFNQRYRKRSISFQTASRWLNGEAVPKKDKLLVLAAWLKVPPEKLDYGSRPGGAEGALKVGETAASYDAQELTEMLRALPEWKRRLVGELIAALRSSR